MKKGIQRTKGGASRNVTVPGDQNTPRMTSLAPKDKYSAISQDQDHGISIIAKNYIKGLRFLLLITYRPSQISGDCSSMLGPKPKRAHTQEML